MIPERFLNHKTLHRVKTLLCKFTRHSTKRSSTSKPWPKTFLSIISPGGTWPYICRQRANLSLSSGTARYTYVSGTRYTKLNGVRSRNSRLFPELNPHRSAGDAFCLGARSSRDLVSNNAMPAPLLLSRQRPPSSFTRHILSHDDDARFSNNLASFTHAFACSSSIRKLWIMAGIWRGWIWCYHELHDEEVSSFCYYANMLRIFEEISIKIDHISVFYMGATF